MTRHSQVHQFGGAGLLVIGLLRCMADEIEAGEKRSATCFAAAPGWDPSHTFMVVVDEQQPMDTTMSVRL
jgi:hypothetical protein